MKSKAIFGLFAFAVVAISAMVYAQTTHAQAVPNPNQAESWCGANGVKFDTGTVGKHTKSPITIDISTVSGKTVVSSASGDGVTITGIVVKGGSEGEDGAGNVKYTAPFSFPLEAPLNNGGQQSNISHVIVCFDDEVVTPPVNYCDTSKVSGGVANWLQKNGINGADCFDYAVEQRCGYLNVSITKQPMPLYAQGPFVAAYTTKGLVAEPYKSFPATFAEDFNGGSVDVTWFTVGPESDWLKNSTTFPNFWKPVGQTITVDTDCEDAEEDDDQAEDVKPGQGGGGTTPTTPETPKTPATPASSISALPYTSGSITPAVAVGVLSILGLVVAAAGSIKSRMLVS